MGTEALVGHGVSIYNYVGFTDALIFKQWRAHSLSRGESKSMIALDDIKPTPSNPPSSYFFHMSS